MGSDSRKFIDSHKSFWNHVVPQISTDSPPKLPALPLFTNVTLRFYFPSVVSFQRVDPSSPSEEPLPPPPPLDPLPTPPLGLLPPSPLDPLHGGPGLQ
jgi:hypothetical protein